MVAFRLIRIERLVSRQLVRYHEELRVSVLCERENIMPRIEFWQLRYSITMAKVLDLLGLSLGAGAEQVQGTRPNSPMSAILRLKTGSSGGSARRS